MSEQIIYNAIETPDGTILASYTRHDYKTYIDTKSNETYMVDGGTAYLRRNKNTVPYIERSEYFVEGNHAHNRKHFHWGGRGKNGDQPLQYRPLEELSDDHIDAIQQTQTHILGTWLETLFEDEVSWRATG